MSRGESREPQNGVVSPRAGDPGAPQNIEALADYPWPYRRRLVYTTHMAHALSTSPPSRAIARARLYARVSSKDQEKEGFSIPAQLKLLREYAAALGLTVAEEYVDVETAKRTGRVNFGRMLDDLRTSPRTRTVLVEKTDRLYRNLKDWVTLDELDVEVIWSKKASSCRASRAPPRSSCTASRC